ncbi:uncharacterized protein RBU33_016234 [Hipposideros larvatus]
MGHASVPALPQYLPGRRGQRRKRLYIFHQHYLAYSDRIPKKPSHPRITLRTRIRCLIAAEAHCARPAHCFAWGELDLVVEDIASLAQVDTIIVLFPGEADQSLASGWSLTAPAGRSLWLLDTHGSPWQPTAAGAAAYTVAWD